MTEEIKKQQEELAMLQFSKEEIQLITGSEVDETSFQRGTLQAQAQVRQAILKAAKDGSTPAQKQFLDFCAPAEHKGDSQEVKKLYSWAKRGSRGEFSSGVAACIAWLFHGAEHPVNVK